MATDSEPTQAELSILKILWDQGPCSVREVQEALQDESGYTTVLKFLQIMHEKGLVDREKEGRKHLYWARVEKKETQQTLLHRFTDQLFDGSVPDLIQRAVRSEQLDDQDLDELQTLLDQLKSGNGDNKND